MKLLKCNCIQCKHGRRKYHLITRTKIKGKRTLVKSKLKQGEYENLPQVISIGYTD